MRTITNAAIQVSVYLMILTGGSAAQAPDALPEGNNGIAKNYPNDTGIANDVSVIYADDFESYSNISGLTSRGKWNEAYHTEDIRIATEAGNYYSGAKALEFTIPKTNTEISNTLMKYINPTQDVVFIRFYTKYNDAFNVLGSSHNGSTISSSYWDGPGSGPGIKADGYNKFLISMEAGRELSGTANPGLLNIYIYHPEQRDVWGDHFFPSGRVIPFDSQPGDFGPYFVPRPETIPDLNRWYEYEIMLKANTPGKRDGRIAFWVDGELAADFLNMRLRDTTDLKIDKVSIDLHIKSNTSAIAKKWYDNVVIATSYIGPLQTTTEVPEMAESLPGDFQLFQNYPNPFNPDTEIPFSLPRSSYVTLEIYNSLGQKITVLVDGNMNPGSYKVKFDASKLASGVYYYAFQAGEFRMVKKMLLIQ